MEACVESVAPVTHIPDAPPDVQDVTQEESEGRSADRPLQFSLLVRLVSASFEVEILR